MSKIEKIDVENLGIIVTESFNGSPRANILDLLKTKKELAEKINEIIDYLNNK